MSLTFELGHLNDLNGDVKEALKSSIFVVQKAAAPKTGVEFARLPLVPSEVVYLCRVTPSDVARAGACKNKNVRSKKFYVQKYFGSQNNCAPKFFCQKNRDRKIFGSENIMGPGPKYFGKKKFGPKKFSVRNFSSSKFQVYKKFGPKEFMSIKIL